METNQIYCECCIDTMRRMPNDFLDATVTSPPYGPMRMYKGFSWDYKAVATELWRVTKPGACVVWVVGDINIDGSEQLISFEQAIYFKSLGFCVETMIYHKNSSVYPGVKRYCQRFEYMFVFSKGLPQVFNALTEKKKSPPKKSSSYTHGRFRQRDGTIRKPTPLQAERLLRSQTQTEKIRGNVWQYNVGFNHSTRDKIAFEHPAIFPEQLAIDHILTWTNPGALVYDPFLGSGTTAKAALLTDRCFIGSEIAPEYCEIARQRIAPLLNNPKDGSS